MEDNLNRLMNNIVDAIPAILGAILVLIIGYIVAKGLQALVRGGLSRAGLDKTVNESPAGNVVSKVTPSLSGALGRLTFWVVFLGAISLSVSVLGVDALNSFM